MIHIYYVYSGSTRKNTIPVRWNKLFNLFPMLGSVKPHAFIPFEVHEIERKFVLQGCFTFQEIFLVPQWYLIAQMLRNRGKTHCASQITSWLSFLRSMSECLLINSLFSCLITVPINWYIVFLCRIIHDQSRWLTH